MNASLWSSVCVCVCVCVRLCVFVTTCVCVFTSIHREGFICLDQLECLETDQEASLNYQIFPLYFFDTYEIIEINTLMASNRWKYDEKIPISFELW